MGEKIRRGKKGYLGKGRRNFQRLKQPGGVFSSAPKERFALMGGFVGQNNPGKGDSSTLLLEGKKGLQKKGDLTRKSRKANSAGWYITRTWAN